MSEAELREAILLPAEAVGLEMERDLALALVQDTAKEPGRLPLLQHALLELFNRRSQDNVLTLAAYTEIGGVQGALTHRADEVLQQLTPEQQRLARRIFVELTELGEGVSDTRRRVSRSQLDYLGDPAQIEKVLQELSDQEARLVVSGAEVEVTHEALIQQWGQLRDWLAEDRENIRLHRRLNAAAREWQAQNQDEAYLYTGSLLAQAEAWAETADNLSPTEQTFLEASKEQRDRAAREREAQGQREAARLRKRALIAAGIGVVAVIAAIVAVVFFFNARRSEQAAVNAEGTALAEKATAVSNKQLADSSAIEAQNAEATAEAEAERAQIAEATAEAEAERANTQAQIALSRQLATQSASLMSTNSYSELALLLAIEAGRAFEPGTAEAFTALRSAIDRPVRLLKIIKAHLEIWQAIWNKDGTRILTTGCDQKAEDDSCKEGTIRIWDANTGEQLLVLKSFSHAQAIWNNDETRILATGCDQPYLNSCNGETLQVWDAKTGEKQLSLEGTKGNIWSAKWNDDETRILTTDFDHRVRIWNAESGDELITLPVEYSTYGSDEESGAASWSPDGTRILAFTQVRDEQDASSVSSNSKFDGGRQKLCLIKGSVLRYERRPLSRRKSVWTFRLR